ncbi:MAG: hypothetical protein ACOC8E_04130 [Planctomycetota bacterium]
MKKWQACSGAGRVGRTGWIGLALAVAMLAAGCGTVGLKVSQPVGTRVELYQKGKWFDAFGPDWGTAWHKVNLQAVDPDRGPTLELEATNSWAERTITAFPRRYRVRFDLADIDLYPGTSDNLVEVWRVREVVPPKYQRVVDLWQQGKTLDALVRLPLPAFADVLYSLGDNFKDLCADVPEKRLAEAREMYDQWANTYLETTKSPSPIVYEVTLKYLFDAEQLDRLLDWIRDGVTLKDISWTGPDSWGLLRVIPFPRTRTTRINIYEDVVLRHLLERKVERCLVHAPTLEVFAEVRTFDTTYFSDRVLPQINLIQGQPRPVTVAVPEKDDVDLLLRTGRTAPMLVEGATVEEYAEARGALVQLGTPHQQTRSVRSGAPDEGKAGASSVALSHGDKVETLRRGLPLPNDTSLNVTSLHSQVLGAVLANQLAYVVVWNNPEKIDASRFLTTVVTADPHGMAKVWAIRDNEVLCTATGTFRSRTGFAGLTGVVEFVVDSLGGLVYRSEKPVAVFAFGNRELEPWTEMRREPVSRVDLIKEFKALQGTSE